MNRKEKQEEPRAGFVNIERRKKPRFSVNLPIQYWPANAPGPIPGHTKDISEGGLMVYLSDPIDIGQTLKLKLPFNSHPASGAIEALVQVVWRDIQVGNDRDYRTGVKFVDIQPPDLERLKKLLWKN